MAFSVSAATTAYPVVPGARRRWAGTLTVDNSYVSGTGFVVAATKFGMTSVDFATPQLETTLLNNASFVSGGANLTFKVVVVSTATELASAAGTGLIFPILVEGI